VGESRLSRAENKNFVFLRVSLTKYQSKFSTSDIKMARLAHAPKNIHVKDLTSIPAWRKTHRAEKNNRHFDF
jgi:hypothetical protein